MFLPVFVVDVVSRGDLEQILERSHELFADVAVAAEGIQVICEMDFMLSFYRTVLAYHHVKKLMEKVVSLSIFFLTVA
jgi:hypothetical protein